jgi:hypothetical protein
MSRHLLAAACIALIPAPGLAASPPAATDELPTLKAETIDLTRELQSLEHARQFPDASLTSLHVNVRASGFLLESVAVRITGDWRHDYASSEALALLSDGAWHRLARLRLEPGSYRLVANFKGRLVDARPGEPPVEGQVETPFEKGAQPLDLVLPIVRDELRRNRDVWMLPAEMVAAPAADATGGMGDARFRNALFLKNDGRYLSALVELDEIARTAPKAEALPGAFHLLLAECELGFGLDARAAARYQQIAAGTHDATTLARARLQLAQFEYQHGRTGEARQRLTAMRQDLPAALRDDWRLLATNTLLALGRHAEAVKLLEQEGLERVAPVLRYNLAVALVRDGKVAQGRQQLDEIGRLEAPTLELQVLRDKANLTLGYQYLQQQDGARARAAFTRVRATGPFANRAVLGLGWAEIAQAPAVTPDALRRALTTWTVLAKRDAMDPAVQEGLLAIPWALDRLQAYEDSLGRYLEAITALETARGRMDVALQSIRRGRMVKTIVSHPPGAERGWTWRLGDLPDLPETFFLQSVLAEHRYQEALKRYRDARLLSRHLEDTARRAASLGGAEALRQRMDALRPRAEAIAADQDALLEAVSTRELQGQRSTIEKYLTEARFAVARIYDRQAQQAAP